MQAVHLEIYNKILVASSFIVKHSDWYSITYCSAPHNKIPCIL